MVLFMSDNGAEGAAYGESQKSTTRAGPPC